MSAPAASWCDPAGGSPAQVRGSARLAASVAWPLATGVAKRTQRLHGVLLDHAALPLSTDITKHGREVVARGAEGIARRRKKGPQSCSNSAAPFRIVEVGYIRQRH